MEKRSIIVLFICACIILSGHQSTDANKLYQVFKERKLRNIKHLMETELCRNCIQDIRNRRNLLKTLPKYRSLSKKSCPWCPYMFKVNPDSEDDQHKVDKMQHWYDTGYQQKMRHKRKTFSYLS